VRKYGAKIDITRKSAMRPTSAPPDPDKSRDAVEPIRPSGVADEDEAADPGAPGVERTGLVMITGSIGRFRGMSGVS
jgi:hypothetical protein